MKNKPTIILGIIFLLLVITYLVTSLNPREVTKGAVPLFDKIMPDIDRIEFDSVKREHIVLEKKNETWYITEPFEYKAYDADIMGMLYILFNTFVDGVVSSRVETHDQFSVGESTGTSLKVYSAGNLILDAIVGRQSNDIGHTYARRRGSNDVELWRGMLSQEVVKEAENWRDKILYSFNINDIISIEAVEGGQTRTIAFPDSVWNYTENGVEKPVDQTMARNLVSLIAGLRCDTFASGNDIPRASSKDPEVRVTFAVRNGDMHSFDVWKPDESSNNYLVRKVDGDMLYSFYDYYGSHLVIDYEKLKPGEEA